MGDTDPKDELASLEVTEVSDGDLDDVAGGAAGNSGCNCGCPCAPKSPAEEVAL